MKNNNIGDQIKLLEESLKKCKFVSKPDQWFIEGSEPEFMCLCIYPNHLNYKMEDITGLFGGLTNETFKGYAGTLPREDEETCPFDEFFIYDQQGNLINDLTLQEYLNICGS